MAEHNGERGTVAVYLAAALASFILLTGLLIDFARVAAFRKQLELAVKSGTRSVLSAYDPVVRERYGLFVRGGDLARDLFRRTVEGNLSRKEAGGFRFLDGRWENGDVTESRPLADHAVFRRQMAEEMKYRAPIDLTLEMAARFRGLHGAVREAAATAGTLEQARKAYERRERALDDALRRQEAAGKAPVSAWRDRCAGTLRGRKPDVRGPSPDGGGGGADVRGLCEEKGGGRCSAGEACGMGGAQKNARRDGRTEAGAPALRRGDFRLRTGRVRTGGAAAQGGGGSAGGRGKR